MGRDGYMENKRQMRSDEGNQMSHKRHQLIKIASNLRITAARDARHGERLKSSLYVIE